MSSDGWMDKEDMVYTYNGILSRLTKEGTFDACYSVNEPWGQYAKWNKPVTKRQKLINSTYMRSVQSLKS